MATTERRRNRWLWFVGLYAASIIGVAAVAYGLRWLLAAVAG